MVFIGFMAFIGLLSCIGGICPLFGCIICGDGMKGGITGFMLFSIGLTGGDGDVFGRGNCGRFRLGNSLLFKFGDGIWKFCGGGGFPPGKGGTNMFGGEWLSAFNCGEFEPDVPLPLGPKVGDSCDGIGGIPSGVTIIGLFSDGTNDCAQSQYTQNMLDFMLWNEHKRTP